MAVGGYDILGLGVCALDVLCEVDHLPGSDVKMKVDRFIKQGGGLVATALVAAARLGARPAWIGALGDDDFARFCVRDFEREGVGTEYIRTVSGRSVITAFIMAERATGGRTILYTVGEQPRTLPEQVRAEMLDGVRVMHVDLHFADASLRAARLAREQGVTVTADLEYPREGAEEMLALADYAIVPLEFVEAWLGVNELEQAAVALFERTGRGAVVTDGTRGSFVATESERFHQPAYAVDIVDTTGCGDVYHGAFAFGLAKGYALRETARIASATAALKCRALGGRQAIPTLAEVEAFLTGGAEEL